jgi:hypothetical protein
MTIHGKLTMLSLVAAAAVLGACSVEGPAQDDVAVGHHSDAPRPVLAAEAPQPVPAAEAARVGADAPDTDLALQLNQDPRHVVMYQSPTCGCCGEWATHMKEAGYTVEVRKRNDIRSIKERHQLPRWSWSCHTAEVGGKIVEGHVPADLITRMIAEADPAVVGIVVPGMPAGSPGMPDAPGRPLYDVLQLGAGGDLTRWVQR